MRQTNVRRTRGTSRLGILFLYGQENKFNGQRNTVIRRHPKSIFVGAHCVELSEELSSLAEMLDELPNLHIDFSARTPELGRQPYSARDFFLKYADRILFGTDLLPDQRCTDFIIVFSKPLTNILSIPLMLRAREDGVSTASSCPGRFF